MYADPILALVGRSLIEFNVPKIVIEIKDRPPVVIVVVKSINCISSNSVSSPKYSLLSLDEYSIII